MSKSGGTDWVLLLLVATILVVIIGAAVWALLRFRRSRNGEYSAPAEPAQAPEPAQGTVMWPKGHAARVASMPPAPSPAPAPPPPAPEQPEGTVMWPKGHAARVASRPPAPSPMPAPPPPAPGPPEGTVMWPKGQAARAASRPPAQSPMPVPQEPQAEPERRPSFFGALVRRCFPAKKPAPVAFSETVMFPRARGAGTAPEPRAPSFQPPAPPRVPPGGPATFPAPAPKEDPGWAMHLPPAPPKAPEVSRPHMAAETSPPPEVPSEAPGLTLQEEVELLRRQMRELQAQQNKPPSDPAPGPPPRRYP